jgi:hypothetical protein
MFARQINLEEKSDGGIHAIKNKRYKMNPICIRAGSCLPFYTSGGSVGLLLVIMVGMPRH